MRRLSHANESLRVEMCGRSRAFVGVVTLCAILRIRREETVKQKLHILDGEGFL